MKHPITLDTRALSNKALGKRALPRTAIEKLAPRMKRIITQINRERNGGAHAYRDLPNDTRMRRAVTRMATRYSRGFDNVVVLGIGGSALGTIALRDALALPHYNLLARRKRGGPRLFVVDNVDAPEFGGLLDLLKGELDKTLFNVVSKSGQTAETACQFLVVHDLLCRKLGRDEAARHIVATTDLASGTLRSTADQEGFDTLPVPDGVGGRFSVLSAVGLFPAALIGIDTAALLRGAADMDKVVQSTSLRRNPAAQYAAINYLCYQRGQTINVMMPYSNALYSMADWFRQLWAESLGKSRRGRHVGPTPVKALGATDQHSQVQLYREGPDDKLITFLRVDNPRSDLRIPGSSDPSLNYLKGHSVHDLLLAEQHATELALTHSGRPCVTVRFPEISAYTIGQFIMLMEAATTFTGMLLNVNPYDQPGVELGKQITYHLMGKPGFEKMPI